MCKHLSTLEISGKSSDLNFAKYTINGQLACDNDGYVPNIPGLNRYGDYIEFTFCVDCGQILGLELPLKDEDIRDAIERM